MTDMTTPAVSSVSDNGSLRLLALRWGPLLTLVALLTFSLRGTLSGADLTAWSVGAGVLWSPLPFSLPAVMLDHERDTANVPAHGLLRVLMLMPWLMFSPESASRRLARTSVVTWVLMLTGLFVLTGL